MKYTYMNNYISLSLVFAQNFPPNALVDDCSCDPALYCHCCVVFAVFSHKRIFDDTKASFIWPRPLNSVLELGSGNMSDTQAAGGKKCTKEEEAGGPPRKKKDDFLTNLPLSCSFYDDDNPFGE